MVADVFGFASYANLRLFLPVWNFELHSMRTASRLLVDRKAATFYELCIVCRHP